jgi:hypothetical protein
MKPTDFQRWLPQADELTPFQRERALETLTSQNPERACADVIEARVADERRGPRCDLPGATRHGQRAAAVPLRPLPTDLQGVDWPIFGGAQAKGEMAGVRRGFERGGND